MSRTQTVHDLLDSFNINLNLSSECLSLKIEGNFDSYEIIQRTLSFINDNGQIDYGNFECYHFENANCYCEIVPDWFKSNITPSNIQNASDFYNNVKVSKDYDAAEHIRDSQFNIINQVKSWLKNIR